MTDRSRIDAELEGVRLSPDGARLILLLRDAAGHEVSLSLPRSSVTAVMAVASQPREAEVGTIHAVETWNMSLAGNGQDMILTFCTSAGLVMSFTIKSWQAQGMASVATYGTTRAAMNSTVH
jgi:hypothetical protein